MQNSLFEEAILAHLESKGASTADGISDGTGIPRNQILATCKAMCEQDDAIIRMFHDTELIAKGRPKSIYELIPVSQPLCIKILGMLGALKTTDQATEAEIAGALQVGTLNARMELRTLEEFGYVRKKRDAWRISPGIIPPERLQREAAIPLKTRILQLLGSLKISETQSTQEIVKAVSAPEPNVRAELKMLRAEKMIEAGGKNGSAWKLAAGIIPPEKNDSPAPIIRKLTEIKKYIPSKAEDETD